MHWSNSHQFPVLDGYWKAPISSRSRSKMRLAARQKMSRAYISLAACKTLASKP